MLWDVNSNYNVMDSWSAPMFNSTPVFIHLVYISGNWHQKKSVDYAYSVRLHRNCIC